MTIGQRSLLQSRDAAAANLRTVLALAVELMMLVGNRDSISFLCGNVI